MTTASKGYGMRLLEDQEKLREIKLSALRAEIQKGIDSGPGISAEEVFATLHRRIDAIASES